MSNITKRALEQSLKNLLLKKPLTKITISDITADCGMNRMTFYYHFKDIYDLVEWSCTEDARKALEEKKTYDTWQQGFLQIFEAVRENKSFIMNVYRCVHREQVEAYLKPAGAGRGDGGGALEQQFLPAFRHESRGGDHGKGPAHCRRQLRRADSDQIPGRNWGTGGHHQRNVQQNRPK